MIFLSLRRRIINLSSIAHGSWTKRAFLVAQMLRNLPAMQETWVWSLGWEDQWRREWLSTPPFLLGEFRGQRSLVGYSPCGGKELDMTKHSTWELNDLLNLLYSIQGKFLPIQIPQWLPILLYIKCYSIFQWYIKSYRCCPLAIFLKFLCFPFYWLCSRPIIFLAVYWLNCGLLSQSFPYNIFSSWKSFMYIHACRYSYNKLL